jgi:hypothetical protein
VTIADQMLKIAQLKRDLWPRSDRTQHLIERMELPIMLALPDETAVMLAVDSFLSHALVREPLLS